MNLRLPLAFKLIISIVTAIATGCGEKQIKQINNSGTTTSESESRIKFVCNKAYDGESQEYLYSTIARNPERKRPIINWKREDFSGNGFTPQKRCEEVSPRFQKAHDNGSLTYLTHGVMNQQPVICTATQVGGECNTLLITLKHEDNAERTLEQLSNIFLGYASAALEQSSGDINYSEDNRPYVEVNIEEFLNQS